MPIGAAIATGAIAVGSWAVSPAGIATITSVGAIISDAVVSNKSGNGDNPEANTVETVDNEGTDTGSQDVSEAMAAIALEAYQNRETESTTDDTADSGEDTGRLVGSDLVDAVKAGDYSDTGEGVYYQDAIVGSGGDFQSYYDGPTAEQAAFFAEMGVTGQDDNVTIWEAAYYAEYGTSIYGEPVETVVAPEVGPDVVSTLMPTDSEDGYTSGSGYWYVVAGGAGLALFLNRRKG